MPYTRISAFASASTDFVGEVIGGLRVTDTAVILLNGVAGIEVGTESVCRIAKENNNARIFFVNRMDKEHANFDKVYEMTKDRFGSGVAMLQFPVNEGEKFDSIIDVVKMKMYKFNKDKSGKFSTEAIPSDLTDRAADLRNSLMETVSENDEKLLDIFCDVGQLTDEQLLKGLREQLVAGDIIPMICGAAEQNMGVSQLMDLIIDACPSPADKPAVEGVKPNTSDKEPGKITQMLLSLH